MTLLAAELRKLLGPRLLLIAVAISALYGSVFLSPQFERLSSDHPAAELHQLTVRAAQQFGPSISPVEFREWTRQGRGVEQRADDLIAADPHLRALGVRTWRQLTAANGAADEARSARVYAAAQPLLFDPSEGRSLGYTLQSFEQLLGEYRAIATQGLQALPHDSALDRDQSERILRSGSWRAIQDQGLLFAIGEFNRLLAVLVVLVVLLIAAPLPVTDTVRSMRALQYASRRGRAVFAAQLGATLVAAVTASAVASVVAGSVFAASQITPFLGSSLWSWAGYTSARDDTRLLASLLGSAAIAALLAVAAGAAAFALARWSSHYTGLLVRLVIAFALLTIVTNHLLDSPFTLNSPLWRVVGVPGVEVLAAAACAAAALVVCLVLVRRERSRDLA